MAADFDVPGFEAIDASPLRQPRSAVDVEDYRTLGAAAAPAVEAACEEATPSDTERHLAGDVFAEIQAAYGAVDHPDEWRRHRQGGAAGFAGREWIATTGAASGWPTRSRSRRRSAFPIRRVTRGLLRGDW